MSDTDVCFNSNLGRREKNKNDCVLHVVHQSSISMARSDGNSVDPSTFNQITVFIKILRYFQW